MTLPTPSNPLFHPRNQGLEAFTRNTLGICGKWGFQPTFQPLPTLPPYPPEGFAPLGGLGAPFRAHPAGLFLPNVRGVTHHAE